MYLAPGMCGVLCLFVCLLAVLFAYARVPLSCLRVAAVSVWRVRASELRIGSPQVVCGPQRAGASLSVPPLGCLDNDFGMACSCSDMVLQLHVLSLLLLLPDFCWLTAEA